MPAARGTGGGVSGRAFSGPLTYRAKKLGSSSPLVIELSVLRAAIVVSVDFDVDRPVVGLDLATTCGEVDPNHESFGFSRMISTAADGGGGPQLPKCINLMSCIGV